jgi:outer membrane protein TolC
MRGLSAPRAPSGSPRAKARTIRAVRWIAGVAPLVAAPAARAQLTLRDALREGDRAAYANRAAAGMVAERRAGRLAPLEGIVPSVRLEAGWVRTTDPVGAFGTTLRHRAVTPAAFDPRRLNHPGATASYQGGVVAEVPLFNADAWAGRAAAAHAADAAAAAAAWVRLSTRTNVIRTYYATVLAAERVATLEGAARAAHAHVAQAQAMVRAGLVTRSDALLAAVRAGEVDAQLAEARGGATDARAALATLLGRAPGNDVSVPAALPTSARIREIAERGAALDALRPRSDVTAASLGHAAACAAALRARAALLPRVNAVARYDWHSVARPYAGEGSWTVGVTATWSLLGGASELSDVRAASGRAAAALADAEGAAANARLQLDQTRTALGVALTRLTIAEQAVAQGAEAHRLVGRRYAAGLATVTELLDAQAAATRSALALTQARHAVITAAAEHRQAIGADPGTLAALDDEPPVLTPITSR